MKKRTVFGAVYLIIASAAVLWICTGVNNKELVYNQDIKPPFIGVGSFWVDSVFNSLTLDEKIAQTFMVAAYSNKGTEHQQQISSLIKQYNIGGLLFFQGGPVRQAQLTNIYQSAAKTPLLIAMDAEWGLAMRIDSTVAFPYQMMLGAIQDNQLIYEMGADIARQLELMGVHMSFSPVVDVNNNPDNPVINARSFGEDRVNVARKGVAYMMGLQDNHILACAKHFPGHGDTDTDSHLALPVINHSMQRLDSLELYPFKTLIYSGVSGVMVAHLHIPAMDSTEGLASTLSPLIIDSLLIKQIGFKGIVVTDALNMKGVSDYFEPGELEVRALQAGNDILVMPADVPKAIESVKKAISKGQLTEEIINAKCRKILEAKYWSGAWKKTLVDTKNIVNKLNATNTQLLLRKLIEASLTLVKNDNRLVPFQRLDTLKIASVTIGGNANSKFATTLSLYTKVDKYYITENSSTEEINQLISKLKNYNVVIAGIVNTNIKAAQNFGVSSKEIAFVDSLSAMTNVVVDIFGNPYALRKFNNLNAVKCILVSYQDMPLIQDLSAQLLFGGINAKGFLPVSIGNGFTSGTGFETYDRSRLKYTIPEEAGMSSSALDSIEIIANEAIAQKAIPGCQIIVARNNKVIYNQSFGYHTYTKTDSVLNTDLYDIASITKIAATVPSLMRLYEEKKIGIDNKLSDYLPFLDSTNKENIILKDILTHQARLEPWVPFYVSTLEKLYPEEELYSTKQSDIYAYKVAKNRYMTKQVTYKDSVFSHIPDSVFCIEVTAGMYMNKAYRDTIIEQIKNSELSPKNGYKYSDLGFIMFYMMVEKITGEPFDVYVNKHFYAPLGAYTMGYKPLDRFPKNEIIPTENDLLFRKQLIQGYVHDPAAAMLGGVSGHAGIFCTANDLAKLMQMYLNKGIYGGERYFEESTIDYFTTAPYASQGNRRALGFDKAGLNGNNVTACPEASVNSFGHTGFTGTITWVDPDNGLLYVFLSNRVFPDADNTSLLDLNTRLRIQTVIYNSIIK
jgi:beta-N-acetylhexosaminidase